MTVLLGGLLFACAAIIIWWAWDNRPRHKLPLAGRKPAPTTIRTHTTHRPYDWEVMG